MVKFENLKRYCDDNHIEYNECKENQFYTFMNMLIEKNQVMNLTAITDPKEIESKHFIDSLEAAGIIREIASKSSREVSVIDIGTGAGFPGLPLKIALPDVQFTLADSLNKRINFINEVISAIKVDKITAIAGRAEELGQGEHREGYDFCVSRAVADMAVLLEYVLPMVKLGGYALLYKSGEIEEEIKESSKALEVLGGEIEDVRKFSLPDSDMARSIVIIKKGKATPDKYPRRSGKPSKSPIK